MGVPPVLPPAVPAPSVLDVERATLSAVPAPRVAFVGPFVARAFAGGTGRANAAIALDPAPVEDVSGCVARLAAVYARWGLPFRLRSTPLDPPGLDAALRARGMAAGEESLVVGGPLAAFAAADPAVAVLAGPEPDWLDAMAAGEHQTPARRIEKERQAGLLGMPAGWLLLRDSHGAVLGAAFVVADGTLAGFYDLAVRPAARRRGVGRRLLAAGADWALGQGAGWGYAQVAADNLASVTLNAGLGMVERYRYRYWA